MRARCSARMAVKVGGMCWVISTGARSSTPAICVTTVLSACGPPVEAPISSTRGANRRQRPQHDVARSAARRRGARARVGGAGFAAATGRAGVRRSRLARRPSWRIFSISSRRKPLRGGDFARRGRLRDVVGGAERERAQGYLGIAARHGGGHDHDEIALLGQQQRQRGNAVELRHLDVEHHHVGVGALDLVHRLAPGAQRGDQFEIGLRFDPAREQAAHDDGVVDDHDADAPPEAGGGGCGSEGDVHRRRPVSVICDGAFRSGRLPGTSLRRSPCRTAS